MRTHTKISLALVAMLTLLGCPEHADEAKTIEALPNDSLRADYEVFAQRCSKCHSLARPLNSGIDNDDFWRMYVARMRRQPGSGISLDDTTRILRYLSYFSLQQRQKKVKELGLLPDGGFANVSAPVPEVLDAGEASTP